MNQNCTKTINSVNQSICYRILRILNLILLLLLTDAAGLIRVIWFLNNLADPLVKLTQQAGVAPSYFGVCISSLLRLESIGTLVPLDSAHEATSLILGPNYLYWTVALKITELGIHIQAIFLELILVHNRL